MDELENESRIDMASRKTKPIVLMSGRVYLRCSMLNRNGLWMVAALVVLGMASCQNGSSTRSGGDAVTATGGQASKHWVQSEKLKAAMADIAKLHGSLPKNLPDDVESPSGRMVIVAAASAATSADQLATTAESLPRALEGKKISETDRRGFIAMAQTLHDQAIQLRGESERLEIEKMQRTMDALNTTCTACHTQYRELAGDVKK